MMVALSDAEPGVVTKSGMSAVELAKIGKLTAMSTMLKVSSEELSNEPGKQKKELMTWG